MADSTPSIAASIASLLDRQVDDQARLTAVKARTAVTAEELHVQAQLLAPLVPDVSKLLDIQA